MTPLSPPAPESPAAKRRRLEAELAELDERKAKLAEEMEAAKREAEKSPEWWAEKCAFEEKNPADDFVAKLQSPASWTWTLIQHPTCERKHFLPTVQKIIAEVVDTAIAADRAARAAEAARFIARDIRIARKD